MAIYSWALKAVVLSVYGPMYLAGIIGNALVIILVIADRRMHTIPNLFITQLAVGDFMILFFCMPFTIGSIYIFEEWIFGEAFCKANKFFQNSGVYISILTLVAMSFERYFVLLHPLKARAMWTKKVAYTIMISIITVSSLAALPRALVSTLNNIPLGPPHDNNFTGNTSLRRTVALCLEAKGPFTTVYDSLRIVLFYLVPVLVISVLYGRIIGHLRSAHGVKQQLHDNSKVKKERQNVVRMLLAMVLVFAFSWLMFHITLAMELFPQTAGLIFTEDWGTWFMFFAVLALYSSCITNPIIYSFMSPRFRQGFRRILCGCKCVERDEKSLISGSCSSTYSVGSDTNISTLSKG